MILSRRLRNLPITAVRFIRAAKYFFAEHIKVPHDVELQQVNAIHQDISKPLLGATEEIGISSHFIHNLLRSMAGLRVLELHPWLLSSAYIFAYFVVSRHKNDSICMVAYDCMLKGETPTFEVVEHIVNNIIFKCGDLNVASNKNCDGLTNDQISKFRKTIQRSSCKNELQVLVAWPEDLGLICSSNECGNMEDKMLHYFKLFEINNSTADADDKLNYLENKDTELENCSLQDENEVENVYKRILRPRSNTNNELHEKDKDEVRITRSKSKTILKNLDVVDEEAKDNSKIVIEIEDLTKDDDISCRRIMPFVGKTLRKPFYGGPERPIEINYSIDTPETSTDLINSTMLLDIETSSVISNDIDSVMQETNNKLQDIPVNEENEVFKSVSSSTVIENNTPTAIKNDTSGVSINAVSSNKNSSREPETVIHDAKEKTSISSNDADTKLVSSKDLNKKSNSSSNVNKSLNSSNHGAKSSLNKEITCVNNENIRAEVNFTAELLTKNRKPEPISQDSKEKEDTLSNNIDKNIASSKDIKKISSSSSCTEGSKHLKKTSERNHINTVSHLMLQKKKFSGKNPLWKKEHITLIRSTITTTPKKLAPTTSMGNENRDSHNDAEQATQVNKNYVEADHLIGQSQSTSKKVSNTAAVDLQLLLNSKRMNQSPQELPIVKKMCLEYKSNSSAMDSPISAASTSSKLTASNNNTGSTLTREFIELVDLDFEPTMLNSKRMNQSLQELPTVKKMCLECKSNSGATMGFPIPDTTTNSNLTAINDNSDSTLNRKSITVIDLDLEPNAMSQPLQDPPIVKTIRPDAISKSPAMDIPNPVSTTNSSFTAEYKDSSSYMKEVTTKVENPDLEIVEIRKNNTFGRSIPEMQIPSNTASMPSLAPGAFAILFTNSDLSKYSKEKNAAAVDKAISWTNGSLSSQKQSQLRQNTVDNFSRRLIPMYWKSKRASNALIFQMREKARTTAHALLTEKNEVNPVDQENPPQSQQYPLQNQQQLCLLASSHEVNNNSFSSSFDKDFSKFQSNIQQNNDTTNVGGNFSAQAEPVPLNPRLTSFTVSDRPSTIQLVESNKIGSAYQENILQPSPSTNMSTVDYQFPLNRADEEYSANTSGGKPRILTKVRISPLQQQNYINLANNTSTLHNYLPTQQQQQSMRHAFNSATTNSMAAVARHGVNDVLTPVTKVCQAPVNLDNLHYFCDYCPIQLKFESAELLYQHVNDVHNHFCQLCQNRYPSRQALLQHIDEH